MYNKIIEKYYDKNSDLYKLLIFHSRRVAEKAMEVCKTHPELNADLQFIEQAAMFHDIGIFLCQAPSVFCFGNHNYIEHGYLGAQILENEGFERHALVAERHTGTGISKEEIIEKKLPLPHRDFCPISTEEKIICYADKFFSKSKPEKEFSVEQVRKNLGRFGKEKVDIFDDWYKIFS